MFITIKLRHYRMFGLMCKGVRCEFYESFEEKGLPETVSYVAKYQDRWFISDVPESGERSVTKQQAERWVLNGSAEYVAYNEDKSPSWVSDPDHHSHSWLTLEEFKKCLEILYDKCKKSEDYGNVSYSEPEYEAIISAMETLEKHHKITRVVFWFDN